MIEQSSSALLYLTTFKEAFTNLEDECFLKVVPDDDENQAEKAPLTLLCNTGLLRYLVAFLGFTGAAIRRCAGTLKVPRGHFHHARSDETACNG